ncbi:MAG: hypothetical protein ABIQ52_00395 [Vicinamibacterales bacterium]
MTTRHLSDSEFVDLAEATLDARRAAHLDHCDACRAQAGMLRAALHDATAAEVPEPSPLFWNHMTARVREAIALESPHAGSPRHWRGMRGLLPLAAAAALVVAVGAGALLLRDGRREVESPAPQTSAAAMTEAARGEVTAVSDPDAAAAWEVLTTAVSDVEIEEAHAAGMTVHAAALDHAVLSLSAAELSELGRLLQTEMKRASN